MRRWNGWGEETNNYPFPDSAAEYLASLIGAGTTIPDASLDEVLNTVPSSRLPTHPLIQTDPYGRLLHARGQSLPDWAEMRYNQVKTFPDGVAFPQNIEQIKEILQYARETQVNLIPYGGGTSVVGHINPISNETPTLTVDLSRICQLENLDEHSRLATFGAGVNGPTLEEHLKRHGYTLGHFPQSFELSTLGGWIATRSCGQQSYFYGRIEDLFAGGHIETLLGSLDLHPHPASAAGPDLRHVILGSEGRLGFITHATVRIRPIPEREAFFGVFFHNWEEGVQAVREIAQARVPICMARLSNAMETTTTLALSGKEKLISWADRGLRLLRYDIERCLLIFGVTGSPSLTHLGYRQTLEICRKHGGLFTGDTIGKIWRKSRFLTPYLRNTLWERGYAVDTLETALPWSQVLPCAQAILETLQNGLESWEEKVLAFAHLSHVYRDGASVYVTFLFRRCPDFDELLNRWQTLKTAASQVIVSFNATISHQHGVGTDHAPFLESEKSSLGMELLRKVTQTFDPEGIMNPGKGW